MTKIRRTDLALVVIMVLTLGVQATMKVPADLFLFLNSMCAELPDAVWQNLTQLGDTLVLLCCMAPVLWFRPAWIYGLIAAIPLGSFLSLFFKNTFNAPRPGDVLSLSDFHAIAPLLSGHSFPSGHTITAFAFAAVLWISLRQEAPGAFKRCAQAGALLLAAGIGLSRIAMGVHWPQDVLAGACMGWLAGLSGVMLVEKYQAFWQAWFTKWTVLLLLVIGAGYLAARSPLTEVIVIAAVASVLGAALFQAARQLVNRRRLKRPGV
jgi:membrane-associated phospholipid phosphatase